MADTELKKNLIEIKNNDFHVPEYFSDFEAVEFVIRGLHSTDSELRDDLGYTILSKWLIDFKLLNHAELMTLLKRAVSGQMLFFKIGTQDQDDVLLRSFSALLVALILYRDHQERFIEKQDYMTLLDQLNHYCELENDYRSFVEGKGWHTHQRISVTCLMNAHRIGLSENLSVWPFGKAC